MCLLSKLSFWLEAPSDIGPLVPLFLLAFEVWNLRELQLEKLSYGNCCFCFDGSLVILFVLVFNLKFLQGYLSICPDIGLDHQSTKLLLQCCRINVLDILNLFSKSLSLLLLTFVCHPQSVSSRLVYICKR